MIDAEGRGAEYPTCPRCQGRGFTAVDVEDNCDKCGGAGILPRKTTAPADASLKPSAVPKDAITQQVQIVGDYAPDESFCEFVEQTRSQYDDTCRQLAAEVNRLRKALRSLLASAGEREKP